MTMTQTLNSTVPQVKAAEAGNISRQGFHQLVGRYVREPLIQAGLTPPTTVTVREVLAILVGSAIRRMGETRETAKQATDFLLALPADSFGASMERGTDCLYVVNGKLLPRLFRQGDLTSGLMEQLRKDAAAEGIEASERIIHIRPLLNQLLEATKQDPFEYMEPSVN